MSLTDEDKQWIVQALKESQKDLVLLVENVKESLEREIAAVVARLDRVDNSIQVIRLGESGKANWDRQTNQSLREVLTVQEGQRKAIEDLNAQLRKLEEKRWLFYFCPSALLKSAISRAGPVTRRICMPVLARSTA